MCLRHKAALELRVRGHQGGWVNPVMQGAWETLSRPSNAQASKTRVGKRGNQAGCHGGSKLVAEDGLRERPSEGDAVLVGQCVPGHAM